MQLVISCLLIFFFVFTHPSAAQQADNIPRVGFLQRRLPPTPTNPDPLADAFKQGLRELGYIEGQNIRLEHRYAGGKSERHPGLVAEFLQLRVDVIVIPSSQAIRVAKQIGLTIPPNVLARANRVIK